MTLSPTQGVSDNVGISKNKGLTDGSGLSVAGGGAVSPPVNTVAPVISGPFFVGQTLTTTDGTWTGSPTFTYQWQNAGVDIGGATANTYVLVAGDDGDSIRCVVTGTNGGGSASANSNALIALQLILWLDPSDASTITESSGRVSAWADKSGAGNNVAQGTGAKQPLTGTDTINGLNALYFDGARNFPFPAGINAIGASDHTVICVRQYTGSPGESYPLGAASAGQFWGISLNNTGFDYARYAPGAGTSPRLARQYDTNPHLNGMLKTSSTAAYYFNETTVSSVATITEGTLSGGYIGCGFFELNYFTGDLGAIWIASRDWTTTELNQFGNYVCPIWGITWTNR